MSLDESTSCNWSIYVGDVRRSDGDVDEEWCTMDEVSTIANSEGTDLPIDWRSDGDDADLEGVLLFDATNYENRSQCDDVVSYMVDKCSLCFTKVSEWLICTRMKKAINADVNWAEYSEYEDLDDFVAYFVAACIRGE